MKDNIIACSRVRSAGSPDIDYMDRCLVRHFEIERLETAFWDVLLDSNAVLTPGQRRKCRTCRRLDQLTADRLARRIIHGQGLVLPAERTDTVVAASFGALRKASWTDCLRLMHGLLAESIPVSRDFRTLYAPRDAELGAIFLAHRLALRDFVEAELEGDGRIALAPVHALLGRANRIGAALH